MQNTFTRLNKADITKILDYVDSFPFDSTQYLHRKISENEKQKFVEDYEDKEQKQQEELSKFDTTFTIEDTAIINSSSGYGSGYGSSGYGTVRKSNVIRKTTSKHPKPRRKKNGM